MANLGLISGILENHDRLNSKRWFCISFLHKISFTDENDRQIQMSFSEEVFDQLIPTRTLHEIIDEKMFRVLLSNITSIFVGSPS